MDEHGELQSSPTLSPVRLFVSPTVRSSGTGNVEIPPVPSSAALSSSYIEQEEEDLTCAEEFLNPPPPIKPKAEAMEDSMDRYVLSVKGGIMMIAHLWDELYVKLSRMKYEQQALKRTISHLEDNLEDERQERETCATVNKMMARTIHRFKKQILNEEKLNGSDEGCAICARTVNELMTLNLARIPVACCANLICLDCIVRTTHIQQTDHPVCPFCRDPLC